MAQGPGWKKRCKELNTVLRHWVPEPGEDSLEAFRQREELALAGHQWAHDDQNPLEQFVRQLHGMFLAVLRARRQREEEECPLIPPGARRGPQYRVAEEEDSAEPACNGRAAPFTPPKKCAVARRPEQGPRLPRLWVCAAHQHRQCASCAAVGRGVRHSCARGHAVHPRSSVALRGQQRGARRAGAHPPGAGGTPSAKRRRRQRALALGPDPVRPHKRGRVEATPPPPCQEDALSAAGRRKASQSRDRGDITPNPQRFWLRRDPLAQTEQAPETEPQSAGAV